MATIEQNLTALNNTKTAFKNKFANNDVSTTNVEFTNYPNLLDQMEKKLTGQVKNVVPTEELQSITADTGFKLDQVNVSGMRLGTLSVTPSSTSQTFTPPSNLDGYKEIVVGAGGGTDISDTTATASDVLSGKDFYLANGTKTTGTIPTYNGSTTVTENGTLQTSGKYMSSNITVNVSGGGGGDLYTTNRQLVTMKDLQNATFGGGSYDENIYSNTQLDYIQDLFDYILRGA